tara:strand:- start:408 stop:623 length:216 start_codon:yes stop_codon:yes gene_type:complete
MLWYNVLFAIQKEKFMIKNMMIISSLMMLLSHCSTTDFINIAAGVYGGIEKKPNPVAAIKFIKKIDKNDDK